MTQISFFKWWSLVNLIQCILDIIAVLNKNNSTGFFQFILVEIFEFHGFFRICAGRNNLFSGTVNISNIIFIKRISTLSVSLRWSPLVSIILLLLNFNPSALDRPYRLSLVQNFHISVRILSSIGSRMIPLSSSYFVRKRGFWINTGNIWYLVLLCNEFFYFIQ